MSEWIEYTGSDEQRSELGTAKHGVCLMFEHNQKSFVYSLKDISTTDGVPTLSNTVTHYLICNTHPLAEMICQQAMTGQPVWIQQKYDGKWLYYAIGTSLPNWTLANARYSFTPFEDK
jgi:hypothetical protein